MQPISSLHRCSPKNIRVQNTYRPPPSQTGKVHKQTVQAKQARTFQVKIHMHRLLLLVRQRLRRCRLTLSRQHP